MDNMYFGKNLAIKDLGNGISEVKYTHWNFIGALLFFGGLISSIFIITLIFTIPMMILGLILLIMSPSNSFYINAWGVSKDKTMKNIIKFEDINSITNGKPRGFGGGNVTLITKTKPVELTSILRGEYTHDMIVNIINEKSAYIRYK